MKQVRDLSWIAGITGGLWLLFLVTAPGSFENGDAVLRYETARSWLSGGGGALDEAFAWSGAAAAEDGRVFTFFGPMQSLLMAPLIAMVDAVGVDPELRDRASFLVISLGIFPLVSALACGFALRALRELGCSRRSSSLAVVTFGLGSAFWYYARVGQEENLVALGLAMILFGLARVLRESTSRAGIWIGIGSAVVLATRMSLVPVLAVLLAGAVACLLRAPAARGAREWALPAGVVLSVAVVLLGAYNYWRFGSVLDGGYLTYFEHFGITAFSIRDAAAQLAALVLSPYRGLVFYSPVLLLAIAGLFFGRSSGREIVVTAASLGFVANLAIHSTYVFWAGGNGWGPRFLVGSSVLLLPGLARFFEVVPRGDWICSLAVVGQVPSVLLPAAREEYLRFAAGIAAMSNRGIWSLSWSPLIMRLRAVPGAIANTLTGRSGEILESSVAPVEVALRSSDFMTVFWWPIRLAVRFQLWKPLVGGLLTVVLAGLGVTILVAAVRRGVLSEESGGAVSRVAIGEKSAESG